MYDPDGYKGPQAVCKVSVSTLQSHEYSFHLTTSSQDRCLLCQSLPLTVSSSTNAEPPRPTRSSRRSVKGMSKGELEVDSQKRLFLPREYSRNLRGRERNIEKVVRWMEAWTPAIMYCSPLALDLANHERGRHETHRYPSYAVQTRIFRLNHDEKSRYLYGGDRYRRGL